MASIKDIILGFVNSLEVLIDRFYALELSQGLPIIILVFILAGIFLYYLWRFGETEKSRKRWSPFESKYVKGWKIWEKE